VTGSVLFSGLSFLSFSLSSLYLSLPLPLILFFFLTTSLPSSPPAPFLSRLPAGLHCSGDLPVGRIITGPFADLGGVIATAYPFFTATSSLRWHSIRHLLDWLFIPS
jgi:hypothetical protein